MSIICLPVSQLSDSHWAKWRELHHRNAEFDSPYFSPEFTGVTAQVRSDVEVAVIEHDGEPVGFLPFQRSGWRSAVPVAGRLNDFHGVLCEPDVEWSAAELLEACGLSQWEFHHLLTNQSQFAVSHAATGESPYIDLSMGFDEYRQAKKQEKRHEIGQSERKARKLEREVAPIRFEYETRDEAAFELLLKWKSAQYKRSGMTDLFRYSWTSQLLLRILDRRDADFAGVFSVLYVGDEVAAVHCGMRSRNVLHYWFPAYNVEFSKYSVGLILMLEMTRHAAGAGIQRIDLGLGDEQHKRSFMNGSTILAEGAVARTSVVTTMRRAMRSTKRWLKTSPLRTPVNAAARWTRPLREWFAFR